MFRTTPFELSTIWQTFICPLTPSTFGQWERYAPAAFLRSVSNLSGPLSRIEPLSSVPVVTIACPLRCHLVDRSEALSKSHPDETSNPSRGHEPRLFGVVVKTCIPSHHSSRHSYTSPSFPLPVRQGLRSCISPRITRDILIAKVPALRPVPRRACYGLQLVCGAVRRFKERCSFIRRHAWLSL